MLNVKKYMTSKILKQMESFAETKFITETDRLLHGKIDAISIFKSIKL